MATSPYPNTGDRAVHNLLDRPRDVPVRTAFGVALIFIAGSADRAYVFLDLDYAGQVWFYRAFVWSPPSSSSCSS